MSIYSSRHNGISEKARIISSFKMPQVRCRIYFMVCEQSLPNPSIRLFPKVRFNRRALALARKH
jgi:hypothetical protein